MLAIFAGREMVALETAYHESFDKDLKWNTFQINKITELGFACTSSCEGEIWSSDFNVTEHTDLIAALGTNTGIEISSIQSFTLLKPISQKLYKVYAKDDESGSYYQAGSIGVAINGRDVASIVNDLLVNPVTKRYQIGFKLCACLQGSVQKIGLGTKIPCRFFLVRRGGVKMEVIMSKEENVYTLRQISSPDDTSELLVDVVLGSLSMSVHELIKIREGEKISFGFLPKLTGFLSLGAEVFAEVELDVRDGEVSLKVNNILL
jgi:hypothetical protein